MQQEIEVGDMEKKVEICLAFLDTLSIINEYTDLHRPVLEF